MQIPLPDGHFGQFPLIGPMELLRPDNFLSYNLVPFGDYENMLIARHDNFVVTTFYDDSKTIRETLRAYIMGIHYTIDDSSVDDMSTAIQTAAETI